MKLKRKFNKIFVLVFFGVTCLFGVGAFGSKIDVPLASVPVDFDSSYELHNVVIENEGYKKRKREPVELSHSQHYLDYDVSCWDCHHDYKGEKNIYSPVVETQKCIDCHDPLSDQGRVMKLEAAYHLNCSGCHRSLAMQREKTAAYRECPDCH